MANVQSPRGLRVAGPLLGCHWYEVSSAATVPLFIGDPVVLTGTSNLVTTATAGSTNILLGAIIGIYDTNKVPGIQASTGERLNYKPTATSCYVVVADHPQQVFIAQGSGTGGSYLDKNDCGGNISLTGSSAGSTISGQSAWTLTDSDTGGTGTTEQIRLIRPVDRPDNTVGIAYCDWYCMINYHQRNAGAVGAGV